MFLLDDVMSELDSARRNQLLTFLSRNRIQTFITAAEEFPINIAIDVAVFNVDNAVITAR